MKPKTSPTSPVVITVFSVDSNAMGYVYLGEDCIFTGNYHDFHPGCFGDAIFDYLANSWGWRKGRVGLANSLKAYLDKSGIWTEVLFLNGKEGLGGFLSTNHKKLLRGKKGLTPKQYEKFIEDIPAADREDRIKTMVNEEIAESRQISAFLKKYGLVNQPDTKSFDEGLVDGCLTGFVLIKNKLPLSFGSLAEKAYERNPSRKGLSTTTSHSDIAVFKDRPSANAFASDFGFVSKVVPAKKILHKFYVVIKSDDEKIRAIVRKNTWIKEQRNYLVGHAVDSSKSINPCWQGFVFSSEEEAREALVKGARARFEEAKAEIARTKRILESA